MVAYFDLILNTVTMFFNKFYVPLDTYFGFGLIVLLLFGTFLSVRFIVYPIIGGGLFRAGSDMAKRSKRK